MMAAVLMGLGSGAEGDELLDEDYHLGDLVDTEGTATGVDLVITGGFNVPQRSRKPD